MTDTPNAKSLAARPGFATPPAPQWDPADPETTNLNPPPRETPTLDPGDGDYWDDEASDWPGSTPTTGTSSPGSTSRRPSTARAEDFLEFTQGLVMMATMGIRLVRTRKRDLPDHVWIADDQDLVILGSPLASLMARHAPVSEGDAGDLGDGLALVAGGGAYALKNVTEEKKFQTPDLDGADA